MKTTAAPIFFDVEALKRYADGRSAASVVLADGRFDPLHAGHVRYLRGARARGDFLAVALHSTGPGHPVAGEADRATVLAGIRFVDAVLVVGDADVGGVMEALRPVCRFRRAGETPDDARAVEVAERLGIETVVADEDKGGA